jgi:hypothetical protein
MTPDNFRLGSISSPDELEELWVIDNSAYGAASITYEKFRDWWRAFPSVLLVLHWGRRIGGAIGLWPLSDRTAARLTNARIKEVALTGRMMRPFRKAPARHWYISGMVLRPELIGTHAIRVLLGDGIRQWFHTGAIAYPCQLLALSPWPEAEDLLTRFGFHCCQKAHAMPDGIALFAPDLATREDFISVLLARLDRK